MLMLALGSRLGTVCSVGSCEHSQCPLNSIVQGALAALELSTLHPFMSPACEPGQSPTCSFAFFMTSRPWNPRRQSLQTDFFPENVHVKPLPVFTAGQLTSSCCGLWSQCTDGPRSTHPSPSGLPGCWQAAWALLSRCLVDTSLSHLSDYPGPPLLGRMVNL